MIDAKMRLGSDDAGHRGDGCCAHRSGRRVSAGCADDEDGERTMSNTLTTTLDTIRKQSPCRDGWATLKKRVGNLADDAPLPVSVVLDSNGLSDSLWVLARACGERGQEIAQQFARECVLRACEHAERVLPIFEATRPGDDRPRRAILTARTDAADAAAYAAASVAAAAARKETLRKCAAEVRGLSPLKILANEQPPTIRTTAVPVSNVAAETRRPDTVAKTNG